MTATRPMRKSAAYPRAEHFRQPVGDSKRPGLRHGGRRVEEDKLDEDIGERDAEKGHHQRGDNLVDALVGAQQRRQQRPRRADQSAEKQA